MDHLPRETSLATLRHAPILSFALISVPKADYSNATAISPTEHSFMFTEKKLNLS